MVKVQALLSAGSSLSGAVRETLPTSLADFAERRDVPRTTLSEALNGKRAPTDTIVDALVAEIGGTADEWRALFSQQRIASATADAAAAVAA